MIELLPPEEAGKCVLGDDRPSPDPSPRFRDTRLYLYYDKAIISIDTLKQDSEHRVHVENATPTTTVPTTSRGCF